jgi:hypothetical protein
MYYISLALVDIAYGQLNVVVAFYLLPALDVVVRHIGNLDICKRFIVLVA